jgi:ubiquinone/menaquinone biosynthesis C-methylase UbiE
VRHGAVPYCARSADKHGRAWAQPEQMTSVREQSREQDRWDEKGVSRLRAIEENPQAFVVTANPLARQNDKGDIMHALSPLAGKSILEVGCGRGDLSVYLAKHGARVSAVDVGPRLIASALRLAEINDVGCDFRVASATSLPFPHDTFDAVVGVAMLHHLSEHDVALAFQEAHRVLTKGGVCLFYEPVENSRVFNFLQNLIPAGKPRDPDYRPSWLNRRAWREYVAQEDQRALTTRELASAGGAPFTSVHITRYGFATRLVRVIGKQHRRYLDRIDTVLLRMIPPLRHLCRTALATCTK